MWQRPTGRSRRSGRSGPAWVLSYCTKSRRTPGFCTRHRHLTKTPRRGRRWPHGQAAWYTLQHSSRRSPLLRRMCERRSHGREEPEPGTLPPATLAALCDVLARHTTSDNPCWFCAWNGHEPTPDSHATINLTPKEGHGLPEPDLLPPELPSHATNNPLERTCRNTPISHSRTHSTPQENRLCHPPHNHPTSTDPTPPTPAPAARAPTVRAPSERPETPTRTQSTTARRQSRSPRTRIMLPSPPGRRRSRGDSGPRGREGSRQADRGPPRRPPATPASRPGRPTGRRGGRAHGLLEGRRAPTGAGRYANRPMSTGASLRT